MWASLLGGDASLGGYRDLKLESIDHARASCTTGGTIAHVEKLTQHSNSDGNFGWEGDTLWVTNGLRATFRVYFCQWVTDVV